MYTKYFGLMNMHSFECLHQNSFSLSSFGIAIGFGKFPCSLVFLSFFLGKSMSASFLKQQENEDKISHKLKFSKFLLSGRSFRSPSPLLYFNYHYDHTYQKLYKCTKMFSQ